MSKKIIFAVCAALTCAPFTFADDLPAPTPAKPWKNSTEISAVNTTGNSRTQTTSGKESFSYGWTLATLDLHGSALGSSASNVVTAEQYAAGEKVDYKLTKLDYLYELFDWDTNRFAGYRHQYNSSTGYGRKILALAHDQLDGELGGGYLNQQRIDASRNDFASGRAYLKYVHLFTSVSSFSQDVEYIHNFQSINGYHLNTETALTAMLSSHLSLKVAYDWHRINEPAPNAGKDDTKLSAALVITY